MPSFIELDKQSTFTPASSVGNLVISVNNDKAICITDSNGVTTVINSQIPPVTLPYLEYAVKLSHPDENPPSTIVLNNTLELTPVWEKIYSGDKPYIYRFKIPMDINLINLIGDVTQENFEGLTTHNITHNVKTTPTYQVDAQIKVIKIQDDGKILVGGAFTTFFGDSSEYLIRLNSDGSVDYNFNGGQPNDEVYAIDIQPDGKILVGGSFTNYGGNSYNLIRLNYNGDYDNTGGVEFGGGGSVFTITTQPDGKILVGGSFTDINNNTAYFLSRLYSNFVIDDEFADYNVSSFNDNVYTTSLQGDGKILVGGFFGTWNGDSSYQYLLRLKSSGDIDDTFTHVLDNDVYAIAIQDDGKILVGGHFGNVEDPVIPFYLARLNTGGTIDNTFTTNIVAGSVRSIALQQDGKILVGTIDKGLYRLNNDGTLDTTFLIQGTNGFDAGVFSVAVDTDKILVGSDSTFSNTASQYFTRLNLTSGLIGINNGFQ